MEQSVEVYAHFYLKRSCSFKNRKILRILSWIRNVSGTLLEQGDSILYITE